MPAPQASMMQQLARLKFTSFNLKVPTNWKPPQGDPGAKHYSDAFQPSEKTSAPGMPPLFQPASLNKYHTDTQKMHVAKVGAFIDGICSAICSAWSTWQSSTTMVGIVVAGPMASAGQLVGPPWMPLILASAPKASLNELKYSNVIATVIATSWLAFTATVKLAGMPYYPAYAALPIPVAPPMPNVPHPFKAMAPSNAPIMPAVMKAQMQAQLGDPMAPFHAELFESICDAFDKCYTIWSASTMVTNVMAIATGGTPLSPLPAVGTAIMAPGGLV